MNESLYSLLGDLKIDDFIAEAKKLIAGGIDYHIIINELMKGLDIVGKKYERGEFFIADLIVSGIVTKEVLKELQISKEDLNLGTRSEKILIGTAKDDIHDIGKDLVKDVLSIYGFQIIDLGVDVSNEDFIHAIDQYEPDFLAVSCVMLTSFRHVMELCDYLEKNEKYNRLKVIVGGAAVKKSAKKYFKKPYFATNMFEGLDFCLTTEKGIDLRE